MAHQKLSVFDGRAHGWFEAGAGETILLVHGIGSDAQVWTEVMHALAGEARLLAWNMPGYGGSDNLEAEAPSAGDYAAALNTFLAARGVGRAHLVGHSLGSIVLAQLLRDWGGEALSLTMLHPVAGAGRFPEEKRESIRRGRAEELGRLGMEGFATQRGRNVLGPTAPEAAIQRHLSIMIGIGERGYLQAWNMMCDSDLFVLLQGIMCPVTVVCGTEDTVAPEALCAEIAERIPGAALKVLEGVGHSPAIEVPERVETLLRGLLQRGPR